MIGGTDTVFWVRDDVPVADIILRAVRRHWPDYAFQDADDTQPAARPLDGKLPQPKGTEFFVYRDVRSAKLWDRYGAAPSNRNTMLYCIVDHRSQPEAHLGSLTIVCDEPTGEVKTILDEIETAFRDIACIHLPPPKPAAA
jgi:hypothetical protein